MFENCLLKVNPVLSQYVGWMNLVKHWPGQARLQVVSLLEQEKLFVLWLSQNDGNKIMSPAGAVQAVQAAQLINIKITFLQCPSQVRQDGQRYTIVVQWGPDRGCQGRWQVQDCVMQIIELLQACVWLATTTPSTHWTQHPPATCCSQVSGNITILQYQTIAIIMVGQVAPCLMIHHSLTSVTWQVWCLSQCQCSCLDVEL